MAAGTYNKKSAAWNLLTSVFFVTAFVLMWTAAFTCSFAKFVSTGGSSAPVVREFGLWYYQYFSYVASPDGTYIVATCHSYPNGVQPDASWKAGRAFAALAWIGAAVIVTVKIFQACSSRKHSADPYNRDGYDGLAPLFLATAAFQGLTLLFLNSAACKNNSLVEAMTVQFGDTCAISQGAKLTISATVFWFAAAATSFLEGKAHADEVEARRLAREAALTEPLAP